MKKRMLIGGMLVIIAVFLFFHQQSASGGAVHEIGEEGHGVIALMTSRYGLEQSKVQELEHTLSQMDLLIKESFDEAAVNKEASAAVICQRMAHMQRVSSLAISLMIAYEQSSGTCFTLERAEDLMLAGYLHDIRKYAEGNHAKQGEKYAEDKVPLYITIDEARLERVGRLIRYHSDALSEKQRTKLGDDVIWEELLQDADTADKILNRGADEAEKIAALNLPSSIELVRQYK